LLKPEFKNSVAIGGDPRTSNEAIQSVFAAGLSTTGGKIDDAAMAGLKYFADLNKKGNFVPIDPSAASLAQGSTPIAVRWDYLALGDRDTVKGNPPIDVVIPKTGIVAGVYVQAISAYAPHPNAAKLWMEWLYADQSQLAWLKGYCHPIRFNDLAKSSKIPADLMKNLPPADSYEKAVFPTLAEQNAAKAEITGKWDSVVVSIFGDGTSSLDARLATSGVVRRIGLSTPHFMAVLATVAGTDMVATTSMLFAKSFAKAYRLRVSEVAFLDMRLSSTIVGSSVRMSDPVMQWFCNVVRIVSEDVRKAVFGDKSASSPSRRTSP